MELPLTSAQAQAATQTGEAESPPRRLRLEAGERRRLWRRLVEVVEGYLEGVGGERVAPAYDPEAIRARLRPYDFDRPVDPEPLLAAVADQLRTSQTHAAHPRYFGLFNPAPTTMGIVADTLVAAFNPQLSAWHSSPLPVEIERHLVRAFAGRFGYPPAAADGTFASGGSEANHTALLVALTDAFPAFATGGLRALPADPVLYVSAEGHRSLVKAARLCGLGTDAVREVPVDARFALDVAALRRLIARDRAAGATPFFVAATAGTTSAGVIEPLAAVADVAAAEGLWFHADAAWGGAAALVPALRPLLAGLQRADSITFDAHKWLSVPMGAGLFLTRHPGLLRRTFGVAAAYVPRYAEGLDVVDPYASSIQWSRRFIGLKLFLSLAAAGWDGYGEAIGHQVRMGERLRRRLRESGWAVVNDTPLPVVCFVDSARPAGRTQAYLEAVSRRVVAGGRAWLSTTVLGGGTPVLRACVSNFATTPADVDVLVAELAAARGRRAAA